MVGYNSQPSNPNFLQQVGWKIEIPRAPNFNYFIQQVNLPAVILPSVKAPNPFVPLNLAGDHLTFGDLRIKYKIDEDMEGYFEIFDWMYSLADPEGFNSDREIFNKPPGDVNGVHNQVSLIMMTNSMNPNREFIFFDCLPVELGELGLEVDADSIQHLTSTLTLSFRSMKYNKTL